MNDFSVWWSGLSLALKIYWGVAIPFTFFFLLQLLLSFLGGGDVPDDTPDIDVETDHGIGFQFLTLKNMVAFFSIFGWTGIACIDSGFSDFASLAIATVAGLIMMSIMASIFYFLGKANASGNLNMRNAIGQVGEVYLPIPANRGSMGKVQIKVQGSLRTLDALTDDDNDLASGKVIKVTEVVNDNILLVTAN